MCISGPGPLVAGHQADGARVQGPSRRRRLQDQLRPPQGRRLRRDPVLAMFWAVTGARLRAQADRGRLVRADARRRAQARVRPVRVEARQRQRGRTRRGGATRRWPRSRDRSRSRSRCRRTRRRRYYDVWIQHDWDSLGSYVWPGNTEVGVDQHSGETKILYGDPDESRPASQVLWSEWLFASHAGYLFGPLPRSVWFIFGPDAAAAWRSPAPRCGGFAAASASESARPSRARTPVVSDRLARRSPSTGSFSPRSRCCRSWSALDRARCSWPASSSSSSRLSPRRSRRQSPGPAATSREPAVFAGYLLASVAVLPAPRRRSAARAHRVGSRDRRRRVHRARRRQPADGGDLVSDGPGRLLAAIYALFALAAGARSVVQIATEFDAAPLAYSLSALAAVVYLVIALTISSERPERRRIARAGCAFELAGVLVVGTASLLDPGAFPDADRLVGLRRRLRLGAAGPAVRGARLALGEPSPTQADPLVALALLDDLELPGRRRLVDIAGGIDRRDGEHVLAALEALDLQRARARRERLAVERATERRARLRGELEVRLLVAQLGLRPLALDRVRRLVSPCRRVRGSFGSSGSAGSLGSAGSAGSRISRVGGSAGSPGARAAGTRRRPGRGPHRRLRRRRRAAARRGSPR